MILLSVYKGSQNTNTVKTIDQDMLWQESHENAYRQIMLWHVMLPKDLIQSTAL